MELFPHGTPNDRADDILHRSADCPPDYIQSNCPGNLRENPQRSGSRGLPSSSPGSPPNGGPYSPEDCARDCLSDEGPRTSPDYVRDYLRNDVRCNDPSDLPNDVGGHPPGGGVSCAVSGLKPQATTRWALRPLPSPSYKAVGSFPAVRKFRQFSHRASSLSRRTCRAEHLCTRLRPALALALHLHGRAQLAAASVRWQSRPRP